MFISILCIDVHPYQYTHCFSLSLEAEFKPLHWLFRLLSLTGYKGPALQVTKSAMSIGQYAH